MAPSPNQKNMNPGAKISITKSKVPIDAQIQYSSPPLGDIMGVLVLGIFVNDSLKPNT